MKIHISNNRWWKVRKSNFIVIYALFSISLLGGLRWRTGTDWPAYFETWQNIDKIKILNEYFEPTFVIILKILKNINQSFVTYIAFLSIATIMIKAIAFWRLERPLVGFYIYFCSFQLDLYPVRYNLALSLVLLALTTTNRDAVSRFLLLIASSIHKAAIVTLVFNLFLSRRETYQSRLIKYTLLTLGIFYALYIINQASFQYKLETGVFSFTLNEDVGVKFAHRIWYFIIIWIAIKTERSARDLSHVKVTLKYGAALYLLIGVVNLGSIERIFGIFIIYEMYFYSQAKFKNQKIVMAIYLFTVCPIRLLQFTSSDYIDLYFPYETILNSSFKEVY